MVGFLNKVMVLGNLGADPVVRSMGSGAKVASFSIATTEKWRDRNSGEQRERTEWHRISLFGDGLVGVVERYLRKGSKVYIEGELRTRKWTDASSGQDKYMTEIVVQGPRAQMIMLSGGGGGTGGGGDEFYDGGGAGGQQSSGQYGGAGGQQSSGQYGGEQAGSGSVGGGTRPTPPPDDLDDDIPF